MIFQINYNTDKYDSFYRENQKYIDKLDYTIYNTDDVNYFLNHYGYMTKFKMVKVGHCIEILKVPILCDFIRVAILYELGGIYLDSDTIFHDGIVDLEHDMHEMFGNRNVFILNRSLHFVRGIKKSRYMKYILDKYLSSQYLTNDIKFIGSLNFKEYQGDISVITDKTLSKYFTHAMITGTEINKMKLDIRA